MCTLLTAFGLASANDLATRGPQHLSELYASYSGNGAYDANTPQFAAPSCNPMYGGMQSTNASQITFQEDGSTLTHCGILPTGIVPKEYLQTVTVYVKYPKEQPGRCKRSVMGETAFGK
ncbi:hypothetical protein K474DRAFT_1505567 [Panus rudis PR-1116 ss-1]|nr:hypothetical protein K474DRAFT_1505567 [Panus rudis PR-1116 ss-1]